MKKVIVFGTFDEIEEKYMHMFKEAKEYGDYLVIVIALDDTICSLGGRKPKHNQDARLEQIKLLGIGDKVRLGCFNDHYRAIREEKPDIIALGYNQKIFVDELANNIDQNTRIVRLSPHKPEDFKKSL